MGMPLSVRAEDYQRSSDTIHIPLKYRGLQVRNLCLTVRLEHVLQKMGCSYLGDLEGQTYSSVQEDERVAKSVAGNLHFHDGKTYRLDAYCIMSNHSHLVFAPLEILDPTTTQAGSMRYDEREPRYYSLGKIMHSFKSYTSNESNKILQRSGEF